MSQAKTIGWRFVNKHPPGNFCWIELCTDDWQVASGFYRKLFDWNAPPNVDGSYVVFSVDDKNVGALCQMSDEEQHRDIAPHWRSFVAVRSADEAVGRAQALGGEIIKPPFDVFDAGRMATIRDPTGASLALWEARKQRGADVVNDTGALCWNELITNDPTVARAFYSELFGWTADIQWMGLVSYCSFLNHGQPVAGMLAHSEEWHPRSPEWLVYIAVQDCDTTASEAVSLGGDVLSPPTDIPGVGRFAVVRDPQGAQFAIIRLAATIS